jgi:hypothetical protein
VQLVQTPGLDAPGTPLLDVGESLPPPQRQRLTKNERGRSAIVGTVEQGPPTFGGRSKRCASIWS